MLTKSQKKHGFTLLEIIACMIIISIVSSVTLPAINNFHSTDRVKAEGQLLVTAVRNSKYTALQDNELIRIVFSSDGSFFKQEIYDDPNYENTHWSTQTTPENIVKNKRTDSNLWQTLNDTEEIEFNSSVEVDVQELSEYNYEIYFLPDGYIYYFDSATSKLNKIPENRVLFKYGSAALAVDINALGVISSEAFAWKEDDDYQEEDSIEW